MTIQNYLIIESNIVTNIVAWDGDTSIWNPPQGAIALVKDTTPAIIWQEVPIVVGDKTVFEWKLVDVMGAGGIGFTWDGSVCKTNQPDPSIPKEEVTPPTA
jgi:hypothetical protein